MGARHRQVGIWKDTRVEALQAGAAAGAVHDSSWPMGIWKDTRAVALQAGAAAGAAHESGWPMT